MKTKEYKLQHVMEAAGECWQEGNPTRFISTNPSPDDLNELFRLAEKLKYRYSTHKQSINEYMVHIRTYDFNWLSSETGDTLSGALLSALFIATGGKE